MLTLRLHNHKLLTGWWTVLLAAVLLLGVVGFAAGHGHWSLGSVSTPAYVSNTSSLIGTADGSLVEGSTAVAAQPTVASLPALELLLVILTTLAGVVFVLARLYTCLCRRLA